MQPQDHDMPAAPRVVTWASRPSTELMSVLVVATLALGWLLPAYVHEGTGHLHYWLLMPTLIAAARFGLRGAVATSLLSTLAAGPLSSVLPGVGDTSGVKNWLAEFTFFLSVSAV